MLPPSNFSSGEWIPWLAVVCSCTAKSAQLRCDRLVPVCADARLVPDWQRSPAAGSQFNTQVRCPRILRCLRDRALSDCRSLQVYVLMSLALSAYLLLLQKRCCGLGGVVEQAHLVSWPSVVRGNWTSVVLFCCILGSLLFLICIEFVYLYFPVLFCLSVSVKWLAVKTASKMTCVVLSGALNSTQTNQPCRWDDAVTVRVVLCLCLSVCLCVSLSVSRLNTERKCVRNCHKWHNKLIFLNCSQDFANFIP